MKKHFTMRWLFNRQTGLTLFYVLVLLAVAIAVNLIGIRIAGEIKQWSVWLKDHAGLFLAWRMFLYIAVACGWCWMRKRVIGREQQNNKQAENINIPINIPKRMPNPKVRFMLMEISAFCTILVLEISIFV